MSRIPIPSSPSTTFNAHQSTSQVTTPQSSSSAAAMSSYRSSPAPSRSSTRNDSYSQVSSNSTAPTSQSDNTMADTRKRQSKRDEVSHQTHTISDLWSPRGLHRRSVGTRTILDIIMHYLHPRMRPLGSTHCLWSRQKALVPRATEFIRCSAQTGHNHDAFVARLF